MKGSLWARWKRFAHRAAEIQSIAVLSILYWIVVAPLGMLRRRRHDDGAVPHWISRPATGAVGLEDARRQY